MRDTYHAQRTWEIKERKAQTDLEANIEYFAGRGRVDARRAKRDSDGLTDEQIDLARWSCFETAYHRHTMHVRNGHAVKVTEAEAKSAYYAGWDEVFE